MPWNVKPNNDFIELSYLGVVTPKDLEDAFASAMEIAKEKKTVRFLADCSKMEGGHSIFDLYNLISLFEYSGVPKSFKEALVLPIIQSDKEKLEFYETACLNKGFNVKIFDKKDDAVRWISK